ncbi:nuclear pore complex protein Nup133-like [Dendronephthya gigantea]|uniref:nuclear pore complex protein Nup133-like n=1 Tax=Dendronephthya gigantea TaxID=151771 RepID=UPI00106A5CF4|nr:nuclear pore complex protein Nup133-like [Dendronephthya gigantea]XP_028398503.1 nuclear pore complex protein Nup133-like [Dendronephthya gigantea]
MFNTSELSRSTLSPFTPRNTSRRSLSSPGQSSRLFPRSNRSGTHSQKPSIPARVIEETPLHLVETYGLPLPVQVNEVAAAHERSSPVSVHLDPSGWAWLVFERRLLVWRYKSTEKSKATFCKEFVLPPTELYNSAKLVCLVGAPNIDSRQYGVLAVSPEGLVCYWPSMMYESSPIETETELVGQEFHSLIEFQPHGYLLSTTTNDILLLQIQKKTISFHRFRQPGGVLSGFGRRMSSFIFGANESSSSLLRKIIVEKDCQGSLRNFYALSENSLRKWTAENHGGRGISEKTEVEWNICALFEQQTSQRFQIGLDKVKSFCIDAQESSSGISVLSAMLVQNPELDEARMYYFLGTLDVDDESDTFGRFVSFVQLRFAEEYKEELHQKLVDFQLLIPASSKHAFLYSENIIVPFSIKNTDEVLNKVEFLAEDEGLWGSGFSENLALFFVRRHGIINITATTENESESETEHLASPHQLASEIPAQEDNVGAGDNMGTLRTAFLQFCQGNKDQAQTMCEEQFEDISLFEGVSSFDNAVVNVSQEIIDDYPASDPRWAEAVPADSGSSSASLIIIHQLEDKLKAHDYFVQFLKEVFLSQKLSTFQQFGRIVNTRHSLCGHAEKLKFAIALRRQHNKHQELMDGAIELVMKRRDQDSAPKGLTQQDLFYREVSRISDVISGLLEFEKYKLSQQPTKQDYQEIIMAVNSILENTLQEAWQYRQANEQHYTSSRDDEIFVEFLPWTASTGPDGTRTLLLEQLDITRDRAFPLAEDQKTKAVLVQQLVHLSDILLDGYVTQLNSLRNLDDQSKFEETTQKYELDRRRVISPLVSRGYLEEALSLAEKYRDFDILIEICEELQDQDKLQHYMNLFSTENFSDFAFKWYMDRGKRSKLMSQPTTQHENLSKFLSSHDHLKWLHDIERHSFYQAFDTLKDLSEKEEMYLGRKKTLLSLAKLALLASDESEDENVVQILDDITNQETLITHQETIPSEILQSVSVDPVDMPPLTPDQLIELYISDVNRNRDESDFKKALDVLHIAYTDEDQRDEYETLRLRIWCQAILVDDWANMEADDPILAARNTVFFKTVEVALHEGFDLASYLPSLESFLNSEDLKAVGLPENSTFQYLLRAGYEQILRTHSDMDFEI